MTLQSVVTSLMGIGKGFSQSQSEGERDTGGARSPAAMAGETPRVEAETRAIAMASGDAGRAEGGAVGPLGDTRPNAEARVNGRFPSTAERRAAGHFAQTDAMLLTDLIRGMAERTITPDRVSPERRRECVALMMEEGYTVHQAATAMQVHEGTILRDRAELRRERAMRPDLNLGNELFGEFFEHTMTAIQRMRKLAREEKAPPAVRLRTEEAVCKAYERLLKSALAMRYVETGERRIGRLRELDEAEAVKRRLANGSSVNAEVLGPKLAAMMGMTPVKKLRPERDATPGAG